MKTAMQELITHLEMLKSRVDMVDINSLIDYANSSLEKEKEQIIDARNNGIEYQKSFFNHFANGFMRTDDRFNFINTEEYYNQTYNK